LNYLNVYISNLRVLFFNLLGKSEILNSLNYELEGNKFKLSIESLYSYEYFKYHDKTIKKELYAFKKISLNHERFLDIGALHGIFSFVFTNGNLKKSIAVDPSPIAFPILEKNVNLNSNDIECVQIALSNSKSKIRMKYNWQHLEATLAESDDDLLIESEKMDEFLAKKSFQPDLIKVDVEGYEFFVLKGGENYLSKFRPTIFLELHHEMLRNLNLSSSDVISFLTSLNYTIFDLDMNLFNIEFDYIDGVSRVICINQKK
jgi:FkbM family methyltransferase